MSAIHQFVAGFSKGDAISNEALVLRGVFRGWGFASEIFCEAKRILPELRAEARDASVCAAALRPRDVVLLHLSIGSPLNDLFAALPCRKAILYHNVTPAHYFRAVNRETAENLQRGREQARRLADTARVNLADSRFNAEELRRMGYRDPAVLPLVLDLQAPAAPADRATLRRFGDGRTNILFVGRCAPNKKIEDLLSLVRTYRRSVDPDARLIHAGSWAGAELYYSLLLVRCRELELDNVHFAGSVPQTQLNAFYRCASVFLSMSEHEGFGIPLLESMACDVPVMAYAAAAVPETMDGAGVLFREKRFDLIAEMLGRVVHDPALRRAVVDGQRQRLARYRQRDLAAELKQHLAPLIAEEQA